MGRILVVDDSKLMRKRLVNILEGVGHEIVRECERGDQVLDAFATFQPDMVTMDVNMPGMSGIDALRELKHHYPKAKVVLISSENHELVIMDGIRAGALNYIIKPFQDQNVIKIISRVLSDSSVRKKETSQSDILNIPDEDLSGLILLIDDSKLMLKGTSDLLKQDEHNVLTASTGEMGIDLATNGNPDLILLDIVMPDMDGYEVFNRLRGNEITKHIPVIVYSSLTKKEDILTAMKMGVNEYISKNCEDEVFRSKIKSALYQAKIEKHKHEEESINNVLITQKDNSTYICFRYSLKTEGAMAERKKIFNSAFIKTIEEKNVILDFRQISEMDDDEMAQMKYIFTNFPGTELLIVCGKHYSAFALEFDMEGKNRFFISMGDMEVYLKKNKNSKLLDIVE